MPQFLRAHEMMEYVYNVADVAYPVSIRDQMNRARWLVAKAYDLGFFGPSRDAKYRRILVCGGGAAGVTAALYAQSLGIDTLLVERSPVPFLRQRHCRSRWIDPVQYDWSANHWIMAAFPHAGPAMPLPWPADRSNRLALRWLVRLNAALTNPLFTFRRSDHVIGTPVPITDAAGSVLGIEVSFQSGAKEIFGMMLWCVGFGDERRCAPPNYTGFAFWETDPFERPSWGIQSPPGGCRALVSGGGDGSLQDVIRLSTSRKSAIDVWREIEAGGWSMPQEARHALFTAEDQAQRALLWCGRSSPDEHNALQRLHDGYRQVVDDLTTLHPGRALLIEEVEKLLAANQFPILCVYPCTHFARCYGLNHFLVLLLARVVTLRNLASGPEMRPRLGVLDVSGHLCAANPWTCHGSAHIVNMQHRPLCTDPPGGAAGQVDVRVLVIRHGIAPHPAFLNTPMAFARQVMPYHLP
ncbi:MAG: FAD-dependent oxidoreductase [Isosphaeraceae bacterium]